jgi:hypothetical protein
MPIFSSLYGTRLDRELGTDDSTVLFTTARRKQAINEGLGEFADLTECLVRTINIPITGGTSEYDLNSTLNIPAGDFVRFSKEPIEFSYFLAASSQTQTISGQSLPRRDVRWLDEYEPGWRQSTIASTTMQIPSKHYVRADGPALFVGFTPQPGVASGDSASFKVSYIAQSPTLTSDTNYPYTFNSSVRTDLAIYHQAGVHYAASQLEKLRRDDQASDRQLQKFMGYVTRYLQQMRVKGGRSMMTARSYFGRRTGGWSDPRSRDPRTGSWA